MPLATVADGNCAYRAVSLAMFGTEDHYAYVRLMASIEMLENGQHYDIKSPFFSIEDDRIATSQYAVLVKDVVTPGSYAEMIHLYAISAAFGITLQSYIPPSASVGLAGSPYTTVVAGRDVRRTASPAFTLMWSTLTPTAASPTFNHIVPLKEKSTTDPLPLDVDDDCTFDYAAAQPSDSIDNDVSSSDEESDQCDTSSEAPTNRVLNDDVDNETDTPQSDDAGDDVDKTAPGCISLQGDFLTTAEVMNCLQRPPTGEIC